MYCPRALWMRAALVAALSTVSAAMPAASSGAVSVLRLPLASCCAGTGYFRNGLCVTGPSDTGVHTVCSVVTAEFLAFSISRGNDLSTPRPEYSFPGLKPGDSWCLCAGRWHEAYLAGVAPPVVLAATNAATLRTVPLAALLEHAHEPLPAATAAALLAASGNVLAP